MNTRCIALQTLYGGAQKQQQRNLTRIAAGTLGYVRAWFVDTDGTQYLLARFGPLWVRCAPQCVQLIP